MGFHTPLSCSARQSKLSPAYLLVGIMLVQPTPPPTTNVHCGSCRRWSAGAPQTRSFHGRLVLLPDSTWRRRAARRLRPQATGGRHLQRTQPRAPPPPPPPEPSHLPSPTHGMDSAGRPKRSPYKRACARKRQHLSLVAQTERNIRRNIKQKISAINWCILQGREKRQQDTSSLE